MESLQLQDIHLPESASFWPLALGWWILFAFIIFLAAWLIVKLLKRAKQRKHRAKILARFTTLEKKLKAEPSNNTIAEINTLLRQLAISYYPRVQIASLTGGEWLQFLDESGDTHDFSRGAGRILIEAPYRLDDQKSGNESGHQIENLNVNEFIPLVHSWAKKVIKGGNA